MAIRLTGALGLLLAAKWAGVIPAVGPLLDQLQALRFHLASHTHAAVPRMAGEYQWFHAPLCYWAPAFNSSSSFSDASWTPAPVSSSSKRSNSFPRWA